MVTLSFDHFFCSNCLNHNAVKVITAAKVLIAVRTAVSDRIRITLLAVMHLAHILVHAVPEEPVVRRHACQIPFHSPLLQWTHVLSFDECNFGLSFVFGHGILFEFDVWRDVLGCIGHYLTLRVQLLFKVDFFKGGQGHISAEGLAGHSGARVLV